MTDNLFNSKERDLLSIHEIMKYETCGICKLFVFLTNFKTDINFSTFLYILLALRQCEHSARFLILCETFVYSC